MSLDRIIDAFINHIRGVEAISNNQDINRAVDSYLSYLKCATPSIMGSFVRNNISVARSEGYEPFIDDLLRDLKIDKTKLKDEEIEKTKKFCKLFDVIYS